MIRARFYVQQITQYAGNNGAREVTLQAVQRKTGDNVSWAAATPSGRLVMTVKNDAAIFELGKDYFVTFEVVEPE